MLSQLFERKTHMGWPHYYSNTKMVFNLKEKRGGSVSCNILIFLLLRADEKEGGSVWLTANVVAVLSEAYTVIPPGILTID